jgi:hypothetical protein
MASPTIEPLPPARRRGRPKARTYSPAEAAEWLNVTEHLVTKALDSGALSFFSNAQKRDNTWEIPERDMKALFGPKLYKLLPVQQFADLIGFRVQRVYDYIHCGAIPHVMVFGEYRISEHFYWNLPAQLPACVPGREQSIAQKREKKAAAQRAASTTEVLV